MVAGGAYTSNFQCEIIQNNPQLFTLCCCCAYIMIRLQCLLLIAFITFIVSTIYTLRIGIRINGNDNAIAPNPQKYLAILCLERSGSTWWTYTH